MAALYACPVCSLPLDLMDQRYCCAKNHSFDIHKKGYVNLLLAQNKRSKSPGDDAQMIQSRQRFLRADHYLPLAHYIGSAISDHIAADGNLLDAGCGEGYYLDAVLKQNASLSCYGLDISKPAINTASQNKKIHWSVASSSHPPFVDNSFDVIVSVFSRVDSNPFYRILKSNGWVCMVTPDHDHLLALRNLIYQEVRDYSTDKHQKYFDERFQLIEQHRIEVPIHLNSSQAISDLLGMTPHAHRLPQSAKNDIAALKVLNDMACFKVYWYQIKK